MRHGSIVDIHAVSSMSKAAFEVAFPKYRLVGARKQTLRNPQTGQMYTREHFIMRLNHKR